MTSEMRDEILSCLWNRNRSILIGWRYDTDTSVHSIHACASVTLPKIRLVSYGMFGIL
jgi:hypothetical protein